ncbi:SDR family NAD(P)-dependent oxidoreductase [Flavobacterium lacus]|uniref:NAD(P)-dependent dehydrogenase (Short-subunit alcohol dehydrogenase family) n=1 Tax=Flavobacterium lacus TaxID=1353778 RepID=A0A328WM65_9FLAO|nr:SDR family oxidoreductase [Flavobacterium lacus]RAR47223.1 NAD(P)-dependent dehydrogenase (short-subunit alcohol dehydrogenase family) [Flavobacterium lacus]
MITNPFDLTGKKIVITGASSGLGRQCAITINFLGGFVFLIGRNLERLQETANLLDNDRYLIIEADITDYDRTTDQLEKVLGESKIDGLIHAAGVSTTLPLRNITPQKLHSFFETNVYAGINITKLLTKTKFANPEGMSVVFIASVMGVVGELGKTIYSLTKGALVSGTKSLALELASKKIRVNCISPGVVLTPMTTKAVYTQNEEAYNLVKSLHPLGFGMPEDVANACAFLLSRGGEWITGTNLIVDGGYTAK